MKKLLIALILLTSGVAWAATTQYHQMGNVTLSSSTATGGFGLWNRTVAQLQSLTPTTTGQIVACSNCNIAGTICVSTGSTAAYQWILSTGTACK